MADKTKLRLSKRTIILVAIIAISLILIYLAWDFYADKRSMPENNAAENASPLPAPNIEEGKKLAMVYCKSCHQFPEPTLLNQAKWKNVFPQMGIRMGIKSHRGESYVGSVKGPDLVVPAQPALNDAQWENVIDYYMVNAPIKLPPQNRDEPIEREMPFFAVKNPVNNFFGKNTLATFVKIDNTVKPARLIVADGIRNQIFLLNNQLKAIDSVNTNGPVTDISLDNNRFLVCTIGKELGANSDKVGSVNELLISKTGKMSFNPKPIFINLARPVQFLPADLNGDQRTDYLICEFGSLTGALSWMENKADGTFAKHIISNLPGAIKAYADYPKNSKTPDLWVLFAQGEEGIYHFTNNGNGTFKQQRILQFPPINGSSFFERVDVNHDGFKDLVYTCGDNGNATQVLKPYHGVYIYVNDGHENYHQQYFYPINGCYKAFARDFDGDGEIDLATISLFTDAKQPEEGFVFLKNTGNLNFKAYSLPRDTRFERAVTMDEGDYNGDGKPDLLIGNAFFDFGPFGYNVAEPLFFVLQNKTKLHHIKQ